MTDKSDRTFERMVQQAQDAAEKLGLPPNFLFDILEDSDWSFVIKLSALFESALEEVIFQNCFASPYARPRNEAGLRKFCNSLNVSGRSGKLALATIFNLIGDDAKAYLERLSSLRNRFAHGVSGSSLTIKAVADEGGNPFAFYKGFAAFLSEDSIDVEPGQMRFYFVLTAMLYLWEIEFRSRPLPGILSGVLEDTTPTT